MNTRVLKNIFPVIFSLALAVAIGCFRQDRRTITVAVPQVKSAECFRHIQDAVKSVDGIEQVSPNYERGTVDVTYNAMKLGIRNIEFVIAGAGFDANDTKAPADVRAKLPEGCR